MKQQTLKKNGIDNIFGEEEGMNVGNSTSLMLIFINHGSNHLEIEHYHKCASVVQDKN